MKRFLLFTWIFYSGLFVTAQPSSHDISPHITTKDGTILSSEYEHETKLVTLEVCKNKGLIEFIAVFNGQVIDIVSTCFEDDILTIELPSWVVGTVEIYARTEEETIYIESVEVE